MFVLVIGIYTPFSAMEMWTVKLQEALTLRHRWQTIDIETANDPRRARQNGQAKRALGIAERVLAAIAKYFEGDVDAVNKYDIGVLTLISRIGNPRG